MAPAPRAAAAVAAATAARRRGVPSWRRRLPGEARPSLGSPRRGGAGAGRGRPGPGLAGRDPLGRGAGRGLQGRGLAGGGAAQVGEGRGSRGRCLPPTSARPAGSPAPRCTGEGRIPGTLAPPQGASAQRHPYLCDPCGGGVGNDHLGRSPLPKLPKCSEVAVLPDPRRQCPPPWAPAGAFSGPGQGPLLTRLSTHPV